MKPTTQLLLQDLADDQPIEEPNFGPLVDLFLVVLVAVLLKASFFAFVIDPKPVAESIERASVPVQVLAPDAWRVNSSQPMPSKAAQSAIAALLDAADGGAVIILSLSKDLSAEESWLIRALMQHDWKLPFIEGPPLDLGPLE